jgi:transposase
MITTDQIAPLQEPAYCGIDIAKDEFEADLDGKVLPFDNTAEGIARFLAGLPPNSHLVMEATGHYHTRLVDLAHLAQIAVSVINPTWISNFRKSSGKRAKTDAIDAVVITAYARAHRPSPALRCPASLRSLREMHAVRDTLVSMRVALDNQIAGLSDKKLSAMLRAQIRALEKKIGEIDNRMEQTVEADPDLKQKSDLLRGNKGVGPQCTLTLLCQMPELGTLGRKTVAALAGLAPYNNDSGKFGGKRRIAGGRKKVRKALYMASLSASRYNPVFAKLKAKMKADGKPGKVILIAIARRLLVILNAQIRDNLEAPEQQGLGA